MTRAATRTAAGPTVIVAIEQHFPAKQRILVDPMAQGMLPFGMRVFVGLMRWTALRNQTIRSADRSIPGVWGGVLCRKRYIDEKLAEAIDDGLGAVVNLGAGFDTRAYRLAIPAGVPAWEIDQPVNIEAKQRQLATMLGAPPSGVRLVPIDLDRGALGAELARHGYTVDTRTFFIWEAVTQYLSEAAIDNTLNHLALAAAGSRLAFTYIRKDFIDGRMMYGQESLFRTYVERKRIWLSGLNPDGVNALLAARGWRIVEHLGYEELAECYVTPTGRDLSSSPVERIVLAEKR